MSRKISEYFKIRPKSKENTSFEPKIRECQVILKDIKHQFSSKDFKLFDEVSVNRHKSCEQEKNVCKFCGKKMHSDMIEHIKKVHPTELDLFHCKFCNLKFVKKNFLEIHLKKKHPNGQIERFVCDFDGKVFKTKSKIRHHMEVHFTLVVCKICQKVLEKNSIDPHMTYFHSTERNFNCKICSKSFKSKNKLGTHVKTHNKTVKCEICRKMFPSLGMLNYHNKYSHENAKRFECVSCGKKFNCEAYLKVHQRTHEKNRPKPLKCQRCEFATGDKQSFNYHQKSHERQEKKFAEMKNPVRCEKCLKFCRNKTTLREHVRIVHPKVLFQCDLCAKFIKAKNSLVSHMKVHVKSS